jgi:hypothetical protein
MFHLATFILRSGWMNQHNSRYGYNLDELTNQSDLTQDLASTQGIRVIGKLASTTAVPFRAEMTMFRPRSVTSLKIHMGKIIKVTIGLAEPMKEGDTIRCLLMSQRSERIYNVAQRV